ncbi:MAG: TolC family protein [Planctomycetes bacterium]|nr:TolC family protein [Planctomycetota bacterium]
MYQKTPQIIALITITLSHGCSSPLKSNKTTIDPHTEKPVIVEDINGIIDPDILIELPHKGPTEVEESLASRLEEILELSPANLEDDWESNLGVNLYYNKPTTVSMYLDEAILFAIENNLDIQIASIQPTIKEQSTKTQEAAFDFLFGAGATSQHSNKPQQQVVVGGTPVNSAESSSDTFDGNLSLVRQLYGGGSITLSTNITKTNNSTTGTSVTPDPAWQSIGTIDLTQPLLRNFGETVTRAQVHIAEIVHGQSKEDLRNTLNTVVTTTEQEYLNLALQWKTLQVKTWLLDQGEKVVKILDIRRTYDAGEADYAQAVATVQQRKADVIKQQSLVQKASDAIKKLINTDEFSLQTEEVIQPVGAIEATKISISLRQAIMTSLENRPDLHKLTLAIQAEDINVQVADNARLPQLDMQAQMSFYGLGDTAGDGYTEVFNADYVNYLAGLSFQIPLGNRAAEANYTSSRLQKMSAVATYKQAIQQATIEVKTALRDIVTNAELIRANKAFRIAQAENLRALNVEEETMAGLSPTFLNLKLQTQSVLATARIAEFASIINYNKSISQLYLAMGTTLEMHQVDIE